VTAPPADETPRREREFGKPLAGLRVLVVDDNQDSAESLGMVLELHGAAVAVAYDGPTALSTFKESAPSTVLLDLGMPGMDGFEVARRIRQLGGPSAVTLIALSGWGQERDRRRTRAEGFDHHLVKPVDPDPLLRILGGDARPPTPAG
jgi:CheY-like chemotaxis protein